VRPSERRPLRPGETTGPQQRPSETIRETPWRPGETTGDQGRPTETTRDHLKPRDTTRHLEKHPNHLIERQITDS